jgi:hypothetical protein
MSRKRAIAAAGGVLAGSGGMDRHWRKSPAAHALFVEMRLKGDQAARRRSFT